MEGVEWGPMGEGSDTLPVCVDAAPTACVCVRWKTWPCLRAHSVVCLCYCAAPRRSACVCACGVVCRRMMGWRAWTGPTGEGDVVSFYPCERTQHHAVRACVAPSVVYAHVLSSAVCVQAPSAVGVHPWRRRRVEAAGVDERRRNTDEARTWPSTPLDSTKERLGGVEGR